MRAISSGSPSRSTGVSSASAARSSSVKPAIMSVLMTPGAMTLTVMPLGPSSPGKGLAKADEPCLGRTVGDLAAAAGLAPHAADKQDAAVFTVDHAGQNRAAGVERAVQIDGHHPPPVLVGGVGEQLDLRDAGIADEHLQTAEFLLGPGNGGRTWAGSPASARMAR